MATKRKNPSKRLRFEIFKRDGFTCQYCGAQPPDSVLVCDHIDPVALGGATTIDNLITACESCNQGKSDKPLGSVAKRPDANLMLLEVQQEIAELRQFQAVEREWDNLLVEVAYDLQSEWMTITEQNYPPSRKVLLQMLRKYSVRIVCEAVLVTAEKEANYGLQQPIPYLWGVARRISEQLEDQEDE